MLDVVGGSSFLQKQCDTRSNSAADLDKWSLFSASPGAPTREVESRSSPQASRVGSRAPSLPGAYRVPGESFTTLSTPWSHYLYFCSVAQSLCCL